MAAARTLELATVGQQILIVADAMYVVQGAADIWGREKRLAGPNGDLWERWWNGVAKHHGRVFTKHFHPHQSHIALWATTALEHLYAGNAMADALAEAGAQRHQADWGEVKADGIVQAQAHKIRKRLLAIANTLLERGEVHSTVQKAQKVKTRDQP